MLMMRKKVVMVRRKRKEVDGWDCVGEWRRRTWKRGQAAQKQVAERELVRSSVDWKGWKDDEWRRERRTGLKEKEIEDEVDNLTTG